MPLNRGTIDLKESLQTGGRGLTLKAGTSQTSSLSLPSFVGTVPPLDKVSTFEVNGGPWLVSNQVLLQTLAGGSKLDINYPNM